MDNFNGFIVLVAGSQAIADRIYPPYQDRKALKRLGENGRKTIETNMSHARTAEHRLFCFEKVFRPGGGKTT